MCEGHSLSAEHDGGLGDIERTMCPKSLINVAFVWPCQNHLQGV